MGLAGTGTLVPAIPAPHVHRASRKDAALRQSEGGAYHGAQWCAPVASGGTGLDFALEDVHGALLHVQQLLHMRLRQAMQQRSGAQVAQHRIAGCRIPQHIVCVQIAMQNAARMQVANSALDALQQALRDGWRKTGGRGIHVARATVHAGRAGQGLQT
ncbi:hypothetical protein D3C72_1473600 [compost metagenome]